MRNFKIILEYDGTNYYGWQLQKINRKVPTIQGALEEALKRIFLKRIIVTGSGRTDTGVHANAQCASFNVDTKIPTGNIFRALNTYLPNDIAVKEIREVPISFNARFSSKKKWYRYTILNPAPAHRTWVNRKISYVFHRHYAVYYPYILDLKVMKKACKIIEGKHDFSAIVLAKDHSLAKRKTRQIFKINIKKQNDFIYIDIFGNGFLYKMARRIIGILIDAGRRKITLDEVKKIISGSKIGSEVQTVPAKGLTLMKVYY